MGSNPNREGAEAGHELKPKLTIKERLGRENSNGIGDIRNGYAGDLCGMVLDLYVGEYLSSTAYCGTEGNSGTRVLTCDERDGSWRWGSA